MTLPLLTRIGGLTIAFQISACDAIWVMIICPTLQFSVSSCTMTSRPVFRTDSSIASLVPWRQSSADRSARCSLRRRSSQSPRAISPPCCPTPPTSRPSQSGVCVPCQTEPRGSAPRDSRSAQNMMFRNQEQNRIFAMHRRPKQSGRIFRRARNDDDNPGIMGERRFVSLAMPQTSARQIRAVGRINYQPDISNCRTNASATSRCSSPVG